MKQICLDYSDTGLIFGMTSRSMRPPIGKSTRADSGTHVDIHATGRSGRAACRPGIACSATQFGQHRHAHDSGRVYFKPIYGLINAAACAFW